METSITDSYLWLFLNSALARENLLGAFSLLLLFMARMLPIIALAPFFGSRVLPHPVKIAFALTLFVIFLPGLLTVTTTPLTFNTDLLVLLAKELFIGYLIGFMISIPFSIAQNAGMIIDHQRGGASLMVNDPTVQNQSSPLGTMFNFVLIYTFFLIDGPFLFIDAIYTSFEMVPPDKFFNPLFFRHDSPFGEVTLTLLNTAMKMSIQLATPALMAILMTDVFLGITNRLAPQVQITFLGMPLKSLLGLAVVFLGWQLFVEQMAKDAYFWLDQIKDSVIMFRIET